MGCWVRGQNLSPIFSRREKIMWYRSRTYILREEVTEDGTRYFINFKDGQGISCDLDVSYEF